METRRLVRTDSPGHPPRLSHSSWTIILIDTNLIKLPYLGLIDSLDMTQFGRFWWDLWTKIAFKIFQEFLHGYYLLEKYLAWLNLGLYYKPVMMMSWCLMSSDVIWHIRDKLWPMPKHGSIKATIRKVYARLAVTCHLHFGRMTGIFYVLW